MLYPPTNLHTRAAIVTAQSSASSFKICSKTSKHLQKKLVCRCCAGASQQPLPVPCAGKGQACWSCVLPMGSKGPGSQEAWGHSAQWAASMEFSSSLLGAHNSQNTFTWREVALGTEQWPAWLHWTRKGKLQLTRCFVECSYECGHTEG